MSSESNGIDRRTFLRGAAGTAVALPLLECMVPDGIRSSWAAGEGRPGPFYVTGFSGHSIGQGGSNDAAETGLFTDRVSTGDGLDETAALEPLFREFDHPSGETKKLKEYVSLVSNLHIEHEAENNGTLPPGGVPVDPNGRADDPVQWHGYQLLPQFAGEAGHSPHSEVSGRSAYSADQLAAKEWDDQLSQYYCVQAGWYGGSNPSNAGVTNDSISYDGTRRVPTVDPAKAYTNLFNNAPSSAGSDRNEELVKRRRLFAQFRERGVVDAVNESYKNLKSDPALSAADRRRVEAHIQEVRTLEKRIASLRERLASQSPSCEQPESYPGIPVDGSRGWSREDKRAELLSELIVYAFKCGLTRVASVQLLQQQSRLNLAYVLDDDYEKDVHGGMHRGLGGRGVTGASQVVAWDLEQFGYLLRRLGETPLYPGASESLLDRTGFVLFFGGGFGTSYQGGGTSKNGHSGYNMAAFTAGGAGNLAGDRHVRTNQAHPAEVAMTTLEAVGIKKESFGELDWSSISALQG